MSILEPKTDVAQLVDYFSSNGTSMAVADEVRISHSRLL